MSARHVRQNLNLPDVFESMWNEFDNFFSNPNYSRGLRLYEEVDYPPMNLFIEEDSKNLYLEFAVAGIPMENISVNTEGDYLELTIDKKSEEDVNNKYRLIKKGIKTGKAKQKLYIPASKYDTENIKAELNDGILSLLIPSREEVKPRRIPIETKNHELNTPP